MQKSIVAAVVAAALFGVTAHASVVISNLDPNNPSFGLNSPEIGEAVLNGSRTLNLTSVQFDQTAGLTPGETASIFSRNADGTLGTPVFSGFTVGFNNVSMVTTATPTSAFLLLPNTGYFFVLNSNSTTNLEWSYTNSTDYASAFGATIPVGNSAVYYTGATAVYRDLADGPQMFQVNAAAVPEPLSATCVDLALIGGLALWIRRRRSLT